MILFMQSAFRTEVYNIDFFLLPHSSLFCRFYSTSLEFKVNFLVLLVVDYIQLETTSVAPFAFALSEDYYMSM